MSALAILLALLAGVVIVGVAGLAIWFVVRAIWATDEVGETRW